MASAAPEVPAFARDRAFEQLYRKYAQDVYRYALALLRNPADAEDVTQTTFMNAYRAFKRGDKIEKPQNWLIKIAHNAARNRYARASRRVREVPLEDHLEQLAVPESERPNVEAVLDALGRLPMNQRAALVMRELEGRSYAEIADTLGVSVAAVETLIFRARRSLRLKASAIRVLAVVPLPGSLSQFLAAGGNVAAGGGAVAGGGFLLKMVVAIVAGVVATGVNSDRPRQAAAAPSVRPERSPSALASTVAGHGRAAARKRGSGRADTGAADDPSAGSQGRKLRPDDQASDVASLAAAGHRAAAAGASPGGAVQAPTAATPTGPAAPLTASVQSVVASTVGTVESAVGTAQGLLPVPALPAPPPVGVPTPHVQLPPPPIPLPAPPLPVSLP